MNFRDIKPANKLQVTAHIDNMVEVCHQTSVDAGWWVEPDGSPTLDNRYAVSNKLSLIHSDVGEATEGDRKGKTDEHLPQYPNIIVELADAYIRILDLAGALLRRWGATYTFGEVVMAKMAYNQQRADHSIENRGRDGGKRY